jgi:peptidoglycan hydrolase CwlO-like protein
MLSPALTVVISLMLVAAIGYLIGSATGKRTASSASTPQSRHIQQESDELNQRLLETETDRDTLRDQLERSEGQRDAGDEATDAAAQELERRDEALAEIRAQLHSTQSEVDALRSKNSALEHRLADRQTALDITTSDREVHAGRLQEVTQELETLRRQAAKSALAATDTDGVDVGALRRDVDRKHSQLNNQGGQLREALQALAARDDETGRLRAELEAAHANTAALAANADSQARARYRRRPPHKQRPPSWKKRERPSSNYRPAIATRSSGATRGSPSSKPPRKQRRKPRYGSPRCAPPWRRARRTAASWRASATKLPSA